MNEEILSLINRRENQILVMAAIYYRFNDNLISDNEYDHRGRELMMLAKQYPNEFKASYHYESFIDYINSDTPSTFDINYNSPEVISKAIQLLRLSGRKTTQIINDDTKLKTK